MHSKHSNMNANTYYCYLDQHTTVHRKPGKLNLQADGLKIHNPELEYSGLKHLLDQ